VVPEIEQALPQLPQLALSSVVTVHAPPQQTWSVAQVVPHAPQLALSSAVTVHAPPQQTWPVAQVVPHAPQLSLSDNVSTHELPQGIRFASQTSGGGTTKVAEATAESVQAPCA
jgi:hypothetical protein